MEGDHKLPGEVHILKSLVQPREHFGYIRRFSETEGFFLRFILICVVSGIFSGLSYFVSAEHLLNMPIMSEVKLNETHFRASKYLIAVAGGVIGFIKPAAAVLFMTLVFLPFFRDVGFKKLFVLQTIVYCVFILASVMKLPFQWMLHNYEVLNPLSLGVIANYVSDNAFITSLFGFISVFTVWAFYLTYAGLKQASFKSSTYIITAVSLLYIGFMLLSSLTYALQYGQLTL